MILLDMDMPTSCMGCNCYDGSILGCSVGSHGIPARYNYDVKVKPEWCPIKAEVTSDTMVAALLILAMDNATPQSKQMVKERFLQMIDEGEQG